jgi:hypothetical protein
MGVNLLKNRSFERATLDPWKTKGNVFTSTDQAFEGKKVAQVGPVTAVGERAVLKQRVQLPSDTEALHLSFAVREEPTNGDTAPWFVDIKWLGSGGQVIRKDIVKRQEDFDTFDANDWLTYVDVPRRKPSGAVKARLRFVLTGFNDD